MSALDAIGGVLAALAPARFWSSLDRHVPATGSAAASGILTTIAGGVLGIGGFLEFAQRQASAVNDLVLSSPRTASAGDELSTLVLQGVSALSVVSFMLTPMGIAAAYLTLSGIARAVSATFGDGLGDPLLTAIDSGVRAVYSGVSARHRRRDRERQEGSATADRIVRGVHIGVQAELVVVSSRVKPDWDRGTIVQSGESWFRVGQIEERTIDGYLRTLYPLNAVRDHEAVRRMVRYEIPARYLRAAAGSVEPES